MSDIYIGSPVCRWICPPRIRSNVNVIPSITLPGKQNGECGVPRCDGRQELTPVPDKGRPRLIHTVCSSNTSTMSQLCRPFCNVCLVNLLQWLSWAGQWWCIRTNGCDNSHSADSIPEHMVRRVSYEYSHCDGWWCISSGMLSSRGDASLRNTNAMFVVWVDISENC